MNSIEELTILTLRRVEKEADELLVRLAARNGLNQEFLPLIEALRACKLSVTAYVQPSGDPQQLS